MSDTENKNETTKTETAAPAPTATAPAAPVAKDDAPARTRAKEKQVFATLARGANYAARFGGKVYRFKSGVKVGPLPAALKDYLMETALDELTVTDGENYATTETRPKFVFEEA